MDSLVPASYRDSDVPLGNGLLVSRAGAPDWVTVRPVPAASAEAAQRLRRWVNVACACVLLVLLAPLMALIAVAVRLTSPGPIIYVQSRVGIDRRRRRTGGEHEPRRRVNYGGKLFKIYKFRTMTWQADASAQVWAMRADPRVTPLGRFLRRTRLDELPQLVNVLKGDMNLVGPRPEQPRLFAGLREKVEGYEHRQRVLPGITGWAQVNHGYDETIEDVRAKVRYDLEYIRNQSALQDLRILLRTIPVVLFGTGSR